MKALLLIAHGSRRPQSNDEVRELAKTLGGLAGARQFDLVEAAFLELAEPLIPDGIRHCIEQGADEVIIVPYFLAAGRHVIEDIPADVEQVRDEFPQVRIEIVPHIGASAQMAQMLLDAASQT